MLLSTPSFIFPGTYLENVEFIAGIREISSVELLFYIFDRETELLFLKERDAIREFTDTLGFTVHMPDQIEPRHEEVIEMTSDFARHYIVHPSPGPRDNFLRLLSDWRNRYGDKFLLEKLIEREFETLLPDLEGIPICCDTGHLLIRGEDPGEFLRRYGERIREIHLHGVEEGWDHKPFGPEESWFLDILPFLETFAGVLNLEVFKHRHVEQILDSLRYHSLVGDN